MHHENEMGLSGLKVYLNFEVVLYWTVKISSKPKKTGEKCNNRNRILHVKYPDTNLSPKTEKGVSEVKISFLINISVLDACPDIGPYWQSTRL